MTEHIFTIRVKTDDKWLASENNVRQNVTCWPQDVSTWTAKELREALNYGAAGIVEIEDYSLVEP